MYSGIIVINHRNHFRFTTHPTVQVTQVSKAYSTQTTVLEPLQITDSLLKGQSSIKHESSSFIGAEHVFTPPTKREKH